MTMEEIAPRVFVETEYAGVNVGVIVTSDGLICIDAPSYPRDARHWASQLARLSPASARFLILTDANGDRILNTRWLNARIIAQQAVADRVQGYEKRYPQALVESLTQRNPSGGRDLSTSPVDRPTFSFGHDLTLVKGELRIELLHLPGPMPGSTWVHVPDADVVFTGDSVVVDTFPILAEMSGAAWLESLELLLSNAPLASIVVPGRGPVSTPDAAQPMSSLLREMTKMIRESVRRSEPLEDLTDRVDGLLNRFPSGDLPYGWVRKQLKEGLESLHRELQPVTNGQVLNGRHD